ncbi:MAG: hypothetical protein AAFN41_09550 [Planctomycetota bacterium]
MTNRSGSVLGICVIETAERCESDPSIERVAIDEMTFPLGVYPIEGMEPRQGYTLDFESADGDEEHGEWEEWPDRYVYDIVVSAERLGPLIHSLLSLMPSRVYPILDVLGRDAYREIDPFISYDLMGLDQLFDGLIRYKPFFFEDGLVGFGAMAESPFFYVFVDEHKIVTVRAEPILKERIERILSAFDLVERDDPAGADAVAHEHRGVLLTPPDDSSYLSFDEIVERLRDEWRLLLNVDPETNLDERGRELGVTPWRCIVRVGDGSRHVRYSEVLLTARSIRDAEDLAIDAILGELPEVPAGAEPLVVAADRLTLENFRRDVGETGGNLKRGDLSSSQIFVRRWLDEDPG